jgi:hypothetical protein
MMQGKVITRRVFLSKIFSSGFILLSGFGVSKRSSAEELDKRSPTEEIEERLVHLFKNQESAKIIGRAYLKIVPEENNKKELLSRLAITFDKIPGLYTEADPRNLRKRLRACRQEDFKEGRVITVNKYILSVTEARICALVLLHFSVLSQSLARAFHSHLLSGEQYV